MQVLAREGAWFDLATNGEVDLVRDAGIPPTRCIHSHPIKRGSDIRHALDCGVTTFVVDNAEEIAKFTAQRARVRLLLRVSFRNPDTLIDLSRKFGCDASAAVGLIEEAARLGIRVVGLSFHAGSQLPAARQVRRGDRHLRADHRGGARSRSSASTCSTSAADSRSITCEPAPAIDDFCAPIRAALAALPRGPAAHRGAGPLHRRARGRRDLDGHGPREAGRALVVLPRRRHLRNLQRPALRQDALSDRAAHGTRIGRASPACSPGPTCDSLDVIAEDMPMPVLEIGERLVARQIGAYTMATATDFNYFPRAKVIAVNVERSA